MISSHDIFFSLVGRHWILSLSFFFFWFPLFCGAFHYYKSLLIRSFMKNRLRLIEIEMKIVVWTAGGLVSESGMCLFIVWDCLKCARNVRNSVHSYRQSVSILGKWQFDLTARRPASACNKPCQRIFANITGYLTQQQESLHHPAVGPLWEYVQISPLVWFKSKEAWIRLQ